MTPVPPRRTVDEVAAPYGNFLVPAPPDADDVCPVCRSVRGSGYATCRPCQQALQELGDATADVTAVISIAPRDEQLARELTMYKHVKVPLQVRRRMLTGLAAVLWRWLGEHEPCMAGRTGRSGFDVLAVVPSTSGRADQPLPHLVGGVVSGAGQRYESLLRLLRTDLPQRAQAPDRYQATRQLDGEAVLVIDDTWTTGAHAQSAAAALKVAGAGAVGVLAIGRWFNPGYDEEHQRWLTRHRRAGWDWKRCCLDTGGGP